MAPKRDRTKTPTPKAIAGTSRTGDRETPRSREDVILDLQRQFGNNAVQSLLSVSRDTGSTTATPPTTGAPATGAAGPAQAVDPVEEARRALDRPEGVGASEASVALVALSHVGPAGLLAALRRLGPDLANRIVSFASPGDRGTANYRRIVVLSYAVGGASTIEAWAALTESGADDRRSLLLELLPAPDLARLVGAAGIPDHENVLRPVLRALPRGAALPAPMRLVVKAIFDAVPDTIVDSLIACMACRFAIDFGPTTGHANFTGVQWEAGGLRRSWPVLETLPPAHVEGNRSLNLLTRYQATSTEGVYFSGTLEAGMGYDPTKLGENESGAFTSPGDPLFGRNVFDATVRHEVGHAVDNQLGWSRGSEPAKEKRGGWKDYGSDTTRCAAAMIRASDAGIQRRLSSDKRAQIARILADAMDNQQPDVDAMKTEVRALDWWARISNERKQSVLDDPVFTAVNKGLAEVPWSGGNQPFRLGRHVFLESYDGFWARFRFSAWSRKMSHYQFRAPGEWFAEAYAAYYEPAANVGDVLASKDADTKAYFDRNVHNMRSSR